MSFYLTYMQSLGYTGGAASGTTTRDPEAVDMYQTLIKTIGRYRTATGKRLAQQEIALLKSQVEIAKTNSDMITMIHDVDASNANSVRDALVTHRKTIQDNRTKLVTARSQYNDRLMQYVRDAHRTGSGNPNAAAWEALSGGLFEGPEGTAADIEIPQLLNGMREAGYEGIEFDENYNITRNTYSGTTLGRNIERMFDKAKSVQANQAAAAASIDTEMANLGSTVMFDDASWSTLTPDQKVDAIEDSLGTVQAITRDIRDSDGIDRFDKSQDVLNKLENEDNYVKAAEGDLTKLRTELFGAQATSQDVMGKAVQALVDSGWAESNGFEIGRYIDSDGDGTPDTYAEGPDDRKAMLTWRRQLKGGSGRYGLRGASTGMWVEMDVALSDDQVNEYRTTAGFAYVGASAEEGRWLSGNQVDAELDRAGTSPVKLVDTANETAIMNSSGDFFEYADSDGDGVDDYFVEITGERRTALQAAVADGTADSIRYLRAGTTLDENGDAVPGPPATDKDIITEPGQPTRLTGEDFDSPGYIATDDPNIRQMLRARALEDMGVQFVDEDTFRNLKTHRIVGALNKQHAYDDLTEGVGTVRVTTEYGQITVKKDQLVGNPRVVSKDSKTNLRHVMQVMQGSDVVQALGYGTEQLPTEPKTFQRGGTVFEDVAEVRLNDYDWLESQVGNISEMPYIEGIRDQLAMGTAEGIQEIEGSIDKVSADLAAAEKHLAEFDAVTEELVKSAVSGTDEIGLRRDRKEERDRLVGERNGLQSDLNKLERNLGQAQRQFKRRATPEVEEEVATERLSQQRQRVTGEREGAIAADQERYNDLLANFVDKDVDEDGEPEGIKGLSPDNREFFLNHLVMEEDAQVEARLLDEGLITQEDVDEARNIAASRGLVESRAEVAYDDPAELNKLQGKRTELEEEFSATLDRLRGLKPQYDAVIAKSQRGEPLTSADREILGLWANHRKFALEERDALRALDAKIKDIETRPERFLEPDEKPAYSVNLRTKQGLTKVDRDGDGAPETTIISIDGETEDRIRYDPDSDTYYVRTQAAKGKDIGEVSDVAGADWVAVNDGDPKYGKIESLLFDNGINRRDLKYEDVGAARKKEYERLVGRRGTEEEIAAGLEEDPPVDNTWIEGKIATTDYTNREAEAAADLQRLEELTDPSKPDKPLDVAPERLPPVDEPEHVPGQGPEIDRELAAQIEDLQAMLSAGTITQEELDLRVENAKASAEERRRIDPPFSSQADARQADIREMAMQAALSGAPVAEWDPSGLIADDEFKAELWERQGEAQAEREAKEAEGYVTGTKAEQVRKALETKRTATKGGDVGVLGTLTEVGIGAPTEEEKQRRAKEAARRAAGPQQKPEQKQPVTDPKKWQLLKKLKQKKLGKQQQAGSDVDVPSATTPPQPSTLAEPEEETRLA